MSEYSIAIHGGAGTILREEMSASQEAEYKQALDDALRAGEKVLEVGGSALDAVQASVISMEDCILFNAGRGAVFTHEGKHEMDAALMCGATGNAGAVSGISQLRNPIELCRKIFDHSEHIFLSGEGAMAFAKLHNLKLEPEDWFRSEFRYEQYQQALKTDRVQLDHTPSGKSKFGTVGAVARDQAGNLAAATSTGGMTNKKFGRIGDSPLIGAGTYADNDSCAISCTGHGELFIRAVVAHDVAALMRYKGLSLEEACHEVVQNKLPEDSGGLVAVDREGNICLPFNSEGMYRASSKNGVRTIAIYR